MRRVAQVLTSTTVAADEAQTRGNLPVYVLTLLTAVSFLNYLDRLVISVLLEPIKRELVLSDAQMGLISGFAFAMLYATLGLPLARIADRRSRVALLTVCLTLWSAMTALNGLVRNFIQLFVVRMAIGIGEAGCGPAAHSMLGDIYPRERRAFAISVFQAGGVLGQSVGLALASVIAHVWGWRAALVCVGLLGIPLALLLFFTVREPPRAKDHAHVSAESIVTTWKVLFGRPPLRHLVIGISIAAIGSWGLLQWLPAFFMRTYGLTLPQVGAYLGAAKGAASVLGTVTGGVVMSRLGPRDVRWELWWSTMMLVAGALINLASLCVGDWHVAIGLQIAGGFIGASAGGVVLAAMQTYAEPHRRATALAVLLLLSSFLGLGLGPVAVGLFSDLFKARLGVESLRYALIVISCMPFWGAFHLWLASRTAKRWSLS